VTLAAGPAGSRPADIALLAGPPAQHLCWFINIAGWRAVDRRRDSSRRGKPRRRGQDIRCKTADAVGVAGAVRHRGVDLAIVGDERERCAHGLMRRRGEVDADFLTSGGASAGDADQNVSRLAFQKPGALDLWRIAGPKTGAALGLACGGHACFGLPVNPVAAMVCTLIFAPCVWRGWRGQDWPWPQGLTWSAEFSKLKNTVGDPFWGYCDLRRHCHKGWRFLRGPWDKACGQQSDSRHCARAICVMGAKGLTGYSGRRGETKRRPCCAMKGPQGLLI